MSYLNDGDAFTLWNQLKDIKVGVYKIARTFSSTSKLSHLKLNYQKIKQTRMDHLFSDFEHKVLTTHSEDILQENAVNMTVTLLKKRIKIEFDASVLKNHVMHEMVNKLFKPLVASITLETKRHRFWAEEECDDKVQVSNLGIGIEEETWYGSIDGCLRAHSGEVPFLNDSEEEPETDGTSTCLELKRASKRLSQVIGSAVLTSFIGNRLHPQLNALVPCILLNCISTQYIFYDCVKDVLLISEKVDLYDDHGRVSQQAMLIMWLVINHRLFLGTVPNDFPKSSLHEKLESDRALESFRSLALRNENWNSGKAGIGSEVEPDTSESDDDVPFGKRRRTS